MTIRKILIEPDAFLRQKSTEVEVVDDSIRTLMHDMLETMYAENGIGLAATQIDIHIRLVVIDISEERDDPMIFVNPEVTVIETLPAIAPPDVE